MLGERADKCLILLVAGTVLLAGAALSWLGGKPEMSDSLPRAPDRPLAGLPDSSAGPSWLPICAAGLGLAGGTALAAAVVMLVGGSARQSGPRSPVACRRCGRAPKHGLDVTCPHCGAALRCPRCHQDLTRDNADVCARCGVPWGCPACGYSLKGLASSPCPTCGAPCLCHRCGATLTYNVTGRCPKCGAAIRGWRAWR